MKHNVIEVQQVEHLAIKVIREATEWALDDESGFVTFVDGIQLLITEIEKEVEDEN